MKKSKSFLILFSLTAAIFLSATGGCQFAKDADALSAGSISSQTTSPLQTESSEVSESGNSRESDAETAEPENEITGLRCSVQLGTLHIVEGEDFQVSEFNGSDYEAYVENGIYIVNGSTAHDNHMEVTIPKDFQFETVELTVAGGALTAENISTQNLQTSCDKGVIDYSGSVDGGAEVLQFQGKTVLNLNGIQTDYNYNLDLDLGHIGIGDEQYAGPHQNQSIDNSAEKAIDASCAMGSISILFSESQ